MVDDQIEFDLDFQPTAWHCQRLLSSSYRLSLPAFWTFYRYHWIWAVSYTGKRPCWPVLMSLWSYAAFAHDLYGSGDIWSWAKSSIIGWVKSFACIICMDYDKWFRLEGKAPRWTEIYYVAQQNWNNPATYAGRDKSGQCWLLTFDFTRGGAISFGKKEAVENVSECRQGEGRFGFSLLAVRIEENNPTSDSAISLWLVREHLLWVICWIEAAECPVWLALDFTSCSRVTCSVGWFRAGSSCFYHGSLALLPILWKATA